MPPPVRPRPFVDLRALARTDPATAEIGRQLNTPAEGGIDLDGDETRLSLAEFQAAATAYAPYVAQRPWLGAALSRLQVQLLRPDLPATMTTTTTTTRGARPPVAPPIAAPIAAQGAAVRVVTARDVEPVATGGIGMPAGFVAHAGGARTAFASRWKDDGSSELVALRAAPGGPFGGETVLARGVDNGTTVDVAGQPFVYFVAATPMGVSVQRRAIHDDGFGPAEDVRIAGAPRNLAWVQAAAAPDGRIVLAFADPQRAPYTAVSDDEGRTFRASASLALNGVDPGTLAHTAVAKDGTMFVTQQRADASGRFASYVRVSTDGLQWSAPRQLTTSSDNVHDAFPLARKDGGVDVYYLMPSAAAGGFVCHRRAVQADLSLGAEQRVTADDVGPVEKPQARRLADGTISLLFARNREFARSYDVAYAHLDGDAPV